MSAEDAALPEYPPKTARYMSWASVQFVTRPSSRLLAGACAGIIALVLGAAALTPLIRVDERVPAQGSVEAYPNAVSATAGEDGSVDVFLAEPGAAVKKGQPIAALHLGPGGEDLPRVLRALSENARRVGAVGPDREMPRGLALGAARDTFPEPAVRERANALEAAARKLDQALRNNLEFAAPRDEFLNANRLLRGALVEYLERHQVRSPAAGTLLQFEQPLHGGVARGQPVATILPREAHLVALMTVEPRHAGELAVGQLVRHRFEAYPYQEYGVFTGRVLRIEQRADPQRGMLYVVRATIEAPSHLPARLASQVHLMRGMRFDSSVITGRKPLFQLVVESLFGKR